MLYIKLNCNPKGCPPLSLENLDNGEWKERRSGRLSSCDEKLQNSLNGLADLSQHLRFSAGSFCTERERERYSLNFHMAREGWVARDPSRCKVTPFSLIECCRNVRTVLHGRQRGLIIVHNKVIINVIVIIATRIYIYTLKVILVLCVNITIKLLSSCNFAPSINHRKILRLLERRNEVNCCWAMESRWQLVIRW